MSDNITVIIEESPRVWKRKVISLSQWKFASTYDKLKESLTSTTIPAPPPAEQEAEFMNFIRENIAPKLNAFLNTLRSSIGALNLIWSKRDTKPANTLFNIVMYLSNINTALNNIKDTKSQLEQEYESTFKTARDMTDEEIAQAELRDSFVEAFMSPEQEEERHDTIMNLVRLVSKAYNNINKYIRALRSAEIDNNIIKYIAILRHIAERQSEFATNFQYIRDRYLGNQEDIPHPLKKELPDTIKVDVDDEVDSSAETVRRPTLTERSPEEFISEEVDLSEFEESPPSMRRPTMAENIQSQELKNAMIKLQHMRFVEELQKASSTYTPNVLAAMLAKYSEQIEDVDLEASLKLIAIAEGILE